MIELSYNFVTIQQSSDLQRYPYRFRPRQLAEHPSGRQVPPGVRTHRFHGQLGHHRRARNRLFANQAHSLRQQRHLKIKMSKTN